MSDAVKRSYRSDVREAQARETRTRILDSAQRLLIDGGYHATSIEAIAAEAGVSVQTVYNAFPTKRAILGALIRRASTAGEAVRKAKDPRAALRLFADDISRRLDRVAPLIMLLIAAAPSDPELAELLTIINRQRLGQLRKLARSLGSTARLRVSQTDAADTLWLLVSAEAYYSATQRRGWSRARYARWLADSLAAILLEPS
jgi:AcrR family transcriptional regulator